MPTESELAAIVAALEQLSAPAQSEPPPAQGWKAAMRHPDLEFDDVRALIRGRAHVR